MADHRGRGVQDHPQPVEPRLHPRRLVQAGRITLPSGATLATDPEALVIAVNVAPTAEDLEPEAAEAPAGESDED